MHRRAFLLGNTPESLSEFVAAASAVFNVGAIHRLSHDAYGLQYSGSNNLTKEETMKLAILTSLPVVFGAGTALAGANNMTSGRPSAVLSDTQCQAIWIMASPNGATISKD